MREKIHPNTFEAQVTCASCGKTWTTISTKKELRIDVCSNCHPFFTGEAARIMDIEGQVDRFYKKLSARQTYVEQQKAKEESMNVLERSVDDLALTPRATDALKKAGILSIGKVLDKLAEGSAAMLEIPGFGQSALTATKKKLRSLEIEIPEEPKKAEEPEATESTEPTEPTE